MDFMAK
jgi:hypothetical protein